MATPVNSAKGAALIESKTGRRCTRQNLEKLCERGALQGSPCVVQAKPLRVDADRLVAEYLARVAPNQAEAVQPRAKREAPAPVARVPRQTPPLNPGEVPILNDERAFHEREKRLIAEMDRKAKEGELLHRDDVTTAWNNAVNLTRTKLLGVPTVVKQRIPHLELEEMEVITGLIREALEELAAGEVAA